MNSDLPNIYAFNDFRIFLEAYRIARKKIDPEFTHQFICTRLGLPHTRGFFNNIVRGRRALTDANIERFIKLLELTDDRALYFRLLVKYNQAANQIDAGIYHAQLDTLNKLYTRQFDTRRSLYYWKWYNSAIRTILGIIEFNGDYAGLAAMVHPPIRPEEAAESIRLMLDFGILVKNKNDVIKPSSIVFESRSGVSSVPFQQNNPENGEAANTTRAETSQINYSVFTNIVGVSDACYDQLLYKVNQFKAEISTLVQKDDQIPTRMYYLNIFLFPESIR